MCSIPEASKKYLLRCVLTTVCLLAPLVFFQLEFRLEFSIRGQLFQATVATIIEVVA